MLVGDSHLRSVADGFVPMPEGGLSFGVMATPGATAAQLRAEVLNAALPRTPDAVCVLAPGNNLTATTTVSQASADFGKLLASVCNLSHNVSILGDFCCKCVCGMKSDLKDVISPNNSISFLWEVTEL